MDVTGTVTSVENDEPIGGVSVEVLRADNGNTLASATTDTTGSYEATFTVEEPSAPDQIRLELSAEGFVDKEVSTGFQPSVTEDVTLEAMSVEATASGTVTDSDTGDPIEGASVTGTRPDGGDQLFQATTSSDGTYEATFGVADEPSEITVQAEAENFDSGERSANFGEQITADVSLQPATIEATVSGTVSRSDTGDPVEGATVTATRLDTGKQLFETTTSSDGSYQGSFEMKATNEPSDVDFTVSAGDFKSGGATVAFAEEIARDFQLEPKTTEATVSGTVTRSDNGDPIDGATVTGSPAGGSKKLFETTTNASGEYETTFEVTVPNEPDQISVAANSGDYDGSEKTVDFGSPITADFALDPSEVNVTIDGTIMAKLDGSTVEGAEVSAFRSNGSGALASTTSEMGGAYSLSFTVLAPDAPAELRLEASERRFEEATLTVEFDESIGQDIALPSIQITTIEELQKLGEEQSYPIDGNYVLANDIDAGGTETMNGGKGFSPIGDKDIPFEGTFNGNGFEITGLAINRPDATVGLFGAIEGGSITDLSLKDVDISTEFGKAGGVVGWVMINGVVSDTRVTGKVITRTIGGGIAGRSAGLIQNCEFRGTVSGSTTFDVGRSLGGIVGFNRGRGSDSGVIKSRARGIVENVTFEGGGLIGSNSGEVIKSKAAVDVSGVDRLGGLVGQNSISQAEVRDSYSSGDVSGEGEGIGGLVGVNDEGQISNSYSVGTVSGSTDFAGLIGKNGGSLSESYWDTEASGQEDGVGSGKFGGATGLTTSEMQGNSAEENMDSFDFQNTWRVVMGDYPALQWEE